MWASCRGRRLYANAKHPALQFVCAASFAQLCAMVFQNCTGCSCIAIMLCRDVFRFGSIFAHCEKSHACTVDAQ